MRWLFPMLAILMAYVTPAGAEKRCTSNCAPNTVCEFGATASWTPSGGATCDAPGPNPDERVTILAGDWIDLNVNGLSTLGWSISGTFTMNADVSANVDEDGFRNITIIAEPDAAMIDVLTTGRIILRAGHRLNFDTDQYDVDGIVFVADGGLLDFQGSVYESSVNTSTLPIINIPADDTAPSCGWTKGRKWTIPLEENLDKARLKRRVIFTSGRLRNRHYEIIGFADQDSNGTDDSIVICSELMDAVSGGQRLGGDGSGVCDTVRGVCSSGMIGVSCTIDANCAAGFTPTRVRIGSSEYRHPVPHAALDSECAGLNAPFACCTGPGEGDCSNLALLKPAHGDTLIIVDDVWVTHDARGTSDSPGLAGIRFAGTNVNIGNSVPPIFNAVNFSGFGYDTHKSIDFRAPDATTDGPPFLYNNVHDYNGAGMSFRGYKNMSIQWNACHNVLTNGKDGSGCLIVWDTEATPSDSAIDGTVVSNNVFYRAQGNHLQFNSVGARVFARDCRVDHNLVYDGCRTNAGECGGLEIDACVNCSINGNVVYDMCAQNGLIGDGIRLAGSTSEPIPDTLAAIDLNRGSYVSNSWIANVCGSGLVFGHSIATADAGQKTAATHNYISNVGNAAIYTGRAFNNVIINIGLDNAGNHYAINNPITAIGNFILGSDSLALTKGCTLCSRRGIFFDDVAGNLPANSVTPVASDNIIVGLNHSSGPVGIYLNTSATMGATLSHTTCDGFGRAYAMSCTRDNAGSGITFSSTDVLAGWTNNGVGIHTKSADMTTCGPSMGLSTQVAEESVNAVFHNNCDTGNDDFILSPNLGWIDRADYNYGLLAGSPALTLGTHISPLGSRAFKFDRDRLNDQWGGGLPFYEPFPVNFENVSGGMDDTDGDGVTSLHDNCTNEENPSQLNSDQDAFGDDCDNCEEIDNPDQGDVDDDGAGDACDCAPTDPARFPGSPEVCDGIDNDCDGFVPGPEVDVDADGFPFCAECNDTDPFTFPGAAEVNDGKDNQCPGDQGFGLIDETSGNSGFKSAIDPTEYSWTPQSGATLYEVIRFDTPDFNGACLSTTFSWSVWMDPHEPVIGHVLIYLNRPIAPFIGSWGQNSQGIERVLDCP